MKHMVDLTGPGEDGDQVGDEIVSLSYSAFRKVLQSTLWMVDVDADWYVRRYPDVEEAIATGVYASAKQHFVENGYFEGRLPRRIQVDENWYLNQYPDVVDGILNNSVQGAQEHFERFGYAEGRLPSPLAV